MNCGGDLNIPYGEVFTTPRLTGTTGLYHVEEICLKGIFYHDLRLTFKDGWVVDATCKRRKRVCDEPAFVSLSAGDYGLNLQSEATQRRILLPIDISWEAECRS